MLLVVTCGAGLTMASGVEAPVSSEERNFFEKKIRPVLVKHCYECHAAGARKLGGKLRLDAPDMMHKGGESGPVFVAGVPSKSLIIQSLRYEHLEMPPKQPLPEAVIKDFETWVKMGAPDPRGAVDEPRKAIVDKSTDKSAAGEADPSLWSFQPVADPPLPMVADEQWCRDPLDRFVLARLEAKGIAPTRDAQPAVLARRLYIDLIGLPPTLDQIESFRAGFARDGQRAVAKLVDELLASPHFGERWGRHWLDVARYGESNGNDGLGRNPTFPHAWRYRDYVIEAFNRDVPYDVFITEQIAGDRIAAASAKISPAERDRLRIATGFLALCAKPAKAMNNNFDMDVVEDQIDVVSTAVMGLSVACARCHDHKHDPIPTRDYYALAGIFNSTETMWGLAANEKLTAPPTPLYELTSLMPTEDATGHGREPEHDPALTPGGAPRFADGYRDAITAMNPAAYLPLDRPVDGVKIEKGVSITGDGYAKFNPASKGCVRVDLAEPTDRYTVSFWFRNDTDNNRQPVTAYMFSFGDDSGKPGPGDHLGLSGKVNKTAAGRLFLFNGPEQKVVLTGEATLRERSWHHVVFVREGDRVRAYINGGVEPDFDGDVPRTNISSKTLFLGGRSDGFGTLDGAIAHFAFFNRVLTPDEAGQLHRRSGQPKGPGKQLPAPEKKPGVDERFAAEPANALAMGVRDKPKPADCKINIKGESKQLGPLVPRGFLSACATSDPPTIDPSQSGRLALARWLTRGDHPQTARVMVNRVWIHLFGRGIVTTPDDFGVYGSRPSHPQLLDHLATRFVEDGWSIKRLIRTIVLSRTYQLGSHASDALIDADPDAAWMSRHRRRRMDAETLRDSMLLVSGQLDREPGKGSAIQHMDVLVNDHANLHKPSNHRSVYLCMMRNAPPPELAAFNLPQFIDVKGQRDVTTLPSQALYLLNSPFVVQQADHFARRLLACEEKSDDARVRIAYRLALNRQPSESEIKAAVLLVRAASASTGDADHDEGNDVRAWAVLCQALLASSEFRYVD